jgi:geranylgeranyl diphosphate synthase type I
MDAMKKLVERYIPLINKELDRVTRGQPEQLYNAARHLLLAGGKRVRPSLTLTYARMLGGSDGEKRALPFAISVELLHNFTLIHDDIMDKDEYRRGVKTVHTIYGENMAIIAGDLLFALSFENALNNDLVPAENRSAATYLLSKASRIVAEGQALDISFEDTWSVSINDYLDMIYRKTGALIEASTGMGAFAVTLDEETVKNAKLYGRNIGISFQLKDDVLGVYGDPAKTGKPVYNDLSRAKKTILVLYAINNLPPDESSELKRIIGMKTSDPELLKTAADLIEKSGAKKFALDLAKKYSDEAIRIIQEIDPVDHEAKNALIEFARYVFEREK